MKELTGVCLNCLGCNRLNDPQFKRNRKVSVSNARTIKYRTNENGGI